MLDAWTKATRGLSETEFRRGVASLTNFERPPSLPEFLKACRPDVNPLNAYYEAIEGLASRERGEMGTWSHPAIYWASVRVSAHDLKNLSYSQIRPRWEAALAAELAKGQWEAIEAPLIAIGPPKGQTPKEKGMQMMQEIKTMAASKNVSNVNAVMGDGKDWARKIMKRAAEGDKSLKLIQIQFAREALRMEGNIND